MDKRREPTDGMDNSSWASRLDDALRNRIAMLLIATFLGTISSLSIVKTTPSIRAEAFTRQDFLTERKDLLKIISGLQERLRVVEQQQSLDNSHREAAIEGYARIRSLEKNCSVCISDLKNTHKEIDHLLERLKSLENYRKFHYNIPLK